MKHADDIRFAKLLRDFPNASVEFVAYLYRLDRLLDEGEYTLKEIEFEKRKLDQKFNQMEQKAHDELEQQGTPRKKKKERNGKD